MCRESGINASSSSTAAETPPAASLTTSARARVSSSTASYSDRRGRMTNHHQGQGQGGGGTVVATGPRTSVRPAPAEIHFKNMHFLITDRPTDLTLPQYIEELKKRNVTDVVRVCEPSYSTERLSKEGIEVLELQFDDGTPPPSHLVEKWFNLLRTRFRDAGQRGSSATGSGDNNTQSACVAVHCVAGLGRAPVLVAIALIELGMKYEDAVEHIRQKRRGAINAKQLKYLEKYRAQGSLKMKGGGGGKKGQCVVQ